jgi:hypothetical protein
MSVLSIQAQRLAEDGLSPSEIEEHLIRDGNPPAQVKEVLASLEDWQADLRSQQAARAGGEGSGAGALHLAIGCILLVLGVVGSLAGPKIFIGAIAVGVLRVARGVAQLAG